MKQLSVVGSTGSIGTQTLEISARNPDQYKVRALAARRSVDKLVAQAREFKVEAVALLDEGAASKAAEQLKGSGIEVLSGADGVDQVAAWPETTMTVSALVGMAGLRPTLSALEQGIDVGLANKEALVVGGSLVTSKARQREAALLPIDSEHSAIFQCLFGEKMSAVEKIILTASGGPFRKTPRAELATKRAKDALKHPTWDMGAKITIDSASLMNKGFEVLEAMHLFDLDLDKVDVWVHPQSIVHSLVEFVDGSVMAQLGPPDMRTPIQLALTYPERQPPAWSKLTLEHMRELTFEAPRWEDFPCLRLAFEAGRKGGTYPAVLNAANEVAVALFLEDRIGFTQIPELLERACEKHQGVAEPTLDDLFQADRWARNLTQELSGARA